MSPAWFGCADRARQRDDPMIGSAPYAQGWLLIEHPGPWAVEAMAGSGIDPTVLRTVSAAASATSTRILLVRRPGRRTVGQSRSWIAVGPTRTVRGRWQTDTDLLAAAATVRSLAAAATVRSPAAAAVRSPAAATVRSLADSAAARSLAVGAADAAAPVPAGEPVVLVCAHGTHDTCCAVRGRAVAAALAARWPESVWECSHLGGDRFAPNVVVLPDATYYGNLESDSAVQVIADHLAGRLDVRWLRGLARFPPPAQAAIAEVHRRLGPLPASAVVAEPAEQLDIHHWRVPVIGAGRRWLATVVAERREPAVLTCRARSATPATAYRVTSLEPQLLLPSGPTSPKSGR